jgi:hypothetical protein
MLEVVDRPLLPALRIAAVLLLHGQYWQQPIRTSGSPPEVSANVPRGYRNANRAPSLDTGCHPGEPIESTVHVQEIRSRRGERRGRKRRGREKRKRERERKEKEGAREKRKRESEREEKERENEHAQYGFAHGISWRRVDDSADFSPSALFSLPFSRPSFLALAIKQSHTHSARPYQARRPSNACTSMRPCPPTCFRTIKALPIVAVAGRHLEMTKARGDEIPGQPPRAASPAPSSSAGGYACSTSRTASG